MMQCYWCDATAPDPLPGDWLSCECGGMLACPEDVGEGAVHCCGDEPDTAAVGFAERADAERRR